MLPGKAENLRYVNCSCHGSDTGGVNLTVHFSLYIYIYTCHGTTCRSKVKLIFSQSVLRCRYIYLFIDVHNRSFDMTLQRQCTCTDRLTNGGSIGSVTW